MPRFKELLLQLQSEFERVDAALAEAESKLVKGRKYACAGAVGASCCSTGSFRSEDESFSNIALEAVRTPILKIGTLGGHSSVSPPAGIHRGRPSSDVDTGGRGGHANCAEVAPKAAHLDARLALTQGPASPRSDSESEVSPAPPPMPPAAPHTFLQLVEGQHMGAPNTPGLPSQLSGLGLGFGGGGRLSGTGGLRGATGIIDGAIADNLHLGFGDMGIESRGFKGGSERHSCQEISHLTDIGGHKGKRPTVSDVVGNLQDLDAVKRSMTTQQGPGGALARSSSRSSRTSRLSILSKRPAVEAQLQVPVQNAETPIIRGNHSMFSLASQRSAVQRNSLSNPGVATTRSRRRKTLLGTWSGSMSSLKVSDFTRSNARVINPEQSNFLERWDFVTLAAVFFVALVTPVQVSMMETRIDALFVLNCFIDAIFLMDMILQFFLMFPRRTDYGYALESRHSEIVKNYLCSWFIIDLVSILPFDAVAIMSESSEFKQFKLVKVVRLLRLLKLIRVLKASRVFNRFETRMSITYGRLALLKFFAILSVITHWLANLWALTLVLVDEDAGVPRWVDEFADLEKNLEVGTKDSPARLYIACLYFTSYTITSVGYGDIGPKNLTERLVLTFMIIISGISWAVVLGQVCGIIANLNRDEQAFRSTMDELNAMMQDRLIPVQMRMRLRSFFLSNKTALTRARHQQIAQAMSPGLRGEVAWEINRRWMEKVGFLRPLLADHSDHDCAASLRSFVLDVSLSMGQVVYAQSEIFGLPHTLYILNRGLVSRKSRLLSTGSVWGTDFVLSDRRLLEPIETYALTYVECTTMHRLKFLHLVEKHSAGFPEIYRTVRRHCVWLAFQRAFLIEARRRVALQREGDASLSFEKNNGRPSVDGEKM